MPVWKEEWEGDMEAAVTTFSAQTQRAKSGWVWRWKRVKPGCAAPRSAVISRGTRTCGRCSQDCCAAPLEEAAPSDPYPLFLECCRRNVHRSGAVNGNAVGYPAAPVFLFFGTLWACHDWSLSLNCSQRRWGTTNEAGFGTFLMLCKYPSENVL